MAEFFAMGGYAAYVWSAFGLSVVAMVGLLWLSVASARRSAREFEALKAEVRPRRKRARQPMVPKRASELGKDSAGDAADAIS